MLAFGASDTSSGSSSTQWIDWFLALKQSKFYCYVDHDYIVDRFNLTGLPTYTDYLMESIQVITDQTENDDLQREAGHVYGLIHARYVLSRFGLHKMMDKYKKGEFGKCPRLKCNQNVLPIGETDIPFQSKVRIYCPCCDDVYDQQNPDLLQVDGAYFGTSFPKMLMLTYPDNFAKFRLKTVEKYKVKLFGFNVRHVK
eukprot:NODE_1275_length_1464_cov_0.668864.p1 type:complete len:198 gc:universal NODE_1275_length_1464_cov_0.668864:710-117(-)